MKKEDVLEDQKVEVEVFHIRLLLSLKRSKKNEKKTQFWGERNRRRKRERRVPPVPAVVSNRVAWDWNDSGRRIFYDHSEDSVKVISLVAITVPSLRTNRSVQFINQFSNEYKWSSQRARKVTTTAVCRGNRGRRGGQSRREEEEEEANDDEN